MMEEDDFGKVELRIVLIKRRDRNKDRVVARLAEEVAQRLHHADHLEYGLPSILISLSSGSSYWKERLYDIDAEHADVFAPVNVEV